MPAGRSNSFFSNSFFIFLIRFFPLLVTLLVLIAFSQGLDTAAYGTYQNFWTQMYLLNSLACMGIHVVIVTYPTSFVANLLSRLNRKYYIGYALWLLLISSVFGLLRHNAGGQWFIAQLFIICWCLSLIIEAVLITAKRFGVLIITNIVYAVAFAILHWQFLQGAFNINSLFQYLLLLVFLKVLINGFVAFRVLSKANRKESKLTVPNIKSLWLHLGFYDVSQMVFRWMDKYIISLFLSAELSAVYFNGSVDIPFLSVILGAAGSASLIQMAYNKEDEDKHDVQLVNYSSRLLSSVVFPLFFFFLFFSKELFVVLLSTKYLPSVPVFTMSILTIPLYAYHLTSILQNRHKGAIINKGAILDLFLALALMYPLYELIGLPGVALSCVISSYVQAGYYLKETSDLLKVKISKLMPLGNWSIKLIVFSTLFIAIHYLLGLLFPYQKVLFLGIATVIIICVLSLYIEIKASKKKYGNRFQTKEDI